MPTKTDTLLVLPLDKIRPSADNVRRAVDDLDELADSIRSVGLLEPLVVRPTKTAGVYDLTAGHRRHAACELAGITQVECIVRAVDGNVGHVVAMLVENLMRKDLTPMEEAMALQRLIDEGGLTQEDIARRVGRKQPTVSARLSLLRLPSRWQNELHSGGITVEAGRELARLDGHPDYMDAAVIEYREAGGRRSWSDVVHEQLRQLDADKVRAVAEAKCKAEGLKVVPHPTNGWWQSKSKPLGKGYDKVDVAVDKHAKLACHAAAIDHEGAVVLVCTKPSTHAPKTTNHAAKTRDAEQERRRLEQEELQEAASVRRIAIGDVVRKHNRKLDDHALFLVTQVFGDERWDRDELAAGFLGLPIPDRPTYDDSLAKAIRAFADENPTNAAKAALALALASAEQDMDSSWSAWGQLELRHLAWLQRNAGYHLAEVERRKLGAAGLQLELPGIAAATRKPKAPAKGAAVVDLASSRAAAKKPAAAAAR